MRPIPLDCGRLISPIRALRRPALLHPIETLTLVYLAATAVVFVLFRRNLPAWSSHVGAHAAGMLFVITWAGLARRRPSRFLQFVRCWYPLIFFIGLFEEIEAVVHTIHPGWFDAWLLRADYTLLGVYPTIWLERYAGLWLNEYMQFAYLSYFLLTPLLGGLLYYRRQWRSFDHLMLGTAVAYYLCYSIFLLFPIEGPYHTLRHWQTVELRGAYFTALINGIEGYGRVHGGAFPSAHVAGSTVALLSAYRFTPRLFWVLLPLVLSLFVATVYGRYHYASDVAAGFLVGGLGFYLASARADRDGP